MKKSIKDTQMKKNLGSRFLILFFFLTYTQANELASYKLYAEKTDVYEKEPVVIHFEASQQDHTDNMMFLLKPKESNAYKIILLNKKIADKRYHDTHTSYTYLLFPLQAQRLSVGFDFTIQTASDKAVAHSYVDDHDDSIAIQTYNTNMPVKPLLLHVKKLSQDVDLVGDFTLSEHIAQEKINQYDAASITYTLKGTGYEDKGFQPIRQIKDVNIFSEVNDLYEKATKKGYAIKREYIYALSAKKDFTIPSVHIKAYSPTKKEYYTLSESAHTIKVEAIDTSKLLDDEESPSSSSFIAAKSLKEFFIYILIFLTGYATAKFQTPILSKKKHSKAYETIKEAQNPKELLFTLINLHKDEEFKKEAKLLEEMVYNNAKHNFQTIKNSLLKGVK